MNKAETDAATVLPLGDDTPTASAAVKAVQVKVDDYFVRCRLAAFDPRALGALNREEKEYLAFAPQNLSRTAQEVAGFPLARIQAGNPAIFQQGTLDLDQRSCTLTLPVDDAGRHAALAGMAGACLAYCDCVRKATGEKRSIVAASTNGDSDNLMAGRNGLFYDREGRDWDATITKIVDNPISLRQTLWSLYKKLVRLIEQQVARRAAAAEAASDAKILLEAMPALAGLPAPPIPGVAAVFLD